IETFEKIPCKNRDTSCPDQLATALKIYKKYIFKDVYILLQIKS
ncbi:TSCPD domain-containing protein, partial [Paeniclostridium sordellii]